MSRLGTILNNLTDRVVSNKMSASSRVTLDSYTSTHYTFPSDGYLSISLGASGSANVSVSLYDSATTYIGEVGGLSNNAYTSQMTFVKKGMKCRISSISNSGHAYFAPL